MQCTLSLDIGTTSTKALLMREDGAILSSHSEPYPVFTPEPGWSEQKPEDWWKAACTAIHVLTDSMPDGAEISAIGLSGQMHGSCFLDEAGQVLRPAILWNDQRTAAECEEIIQQTNGRITEWTLNPPRTAFTASKILWVYNHQPELKSRINKVLLPKDYVRYRLAGVTVTDVTDASGTNLLDVRARQWSEETLKALDIPREWLPELVESAERSSDVSDEAAQVTGIPAGIPIVGGAADQAAAAIGNGVTRPGILSITIGTSGVVYVQLEQVVVDPSGALHTFCHAIPGSWQMMAGVLSAGGSFQWYRDIIGEPEARSAEEQGRSAFDVICELGETAPAGAGGVVFLPYLTGERSPHNDPHARGAFIGLTSRHSRAHLARATLEGISFALRDLVEVLRSLGVPIDQVRLAGGGARSRVWRKILADIVQLPIYPVRTPDASAYGAALLALAYARGENPKNTANQRVEVRTPVEPQPSMAERYDEIYGLFREAYPTLKPLMHRLSSFERAQVLQEAGES